MTIVLAGLDTSTAARPVLETALRIGELAGADVEVVHVQDDPLDSFEVAKSLAEKSGVSFRLWTGRVGPALLTALDAPEVIAAVIGVRSKSIARRPISKTVRHVLEHAHKPVVVVPPEVVAPGSIHRILLPLEGTEPSSRSVRERLSPLLVADVELIVLHVFTEDTVPAMLDRPSYGLETWGREFLNLHLPRAASIELRRGPVATRVAEVSREHGADLIVLSWSQSSSAEQARVVREVLDASELPVLLLPVTALPDEGDEAGASVHGDRH
jgi:nucleotide-binding universal stress UspA family protein